MTYGPPKQWRFPFHDNIEQLRKQGLRRVFIGLCCVVILVILISFSYYTNKQTPPDVKHIVKPTVSTSRHTIDFRTLHIRPVRPVDVDVKESTNKTTVEEKPKPTSQNHSAVAKPKQSEVKPKPTTWKLHSEVEEKPKPTAEHYSAVAKQQQSEVKHNHTTGKPHSDVTQQSDTTQTTPINALVVEKHDLQASEETLVADTRDPHVQREHGPGLETSSIDVTYADTHQQIDWNDPRLDILHMQRPVYDGRYKNPCWEEPLQSPDPYTNNTYVKFSPSAKKLLGGLHGRWKHEYETEANPHRLRCLPYFLIIGQPKCGSTDLFWKLAKHPDIATPPIKELHWWSRSRQGRRFSYLKIIPFDDYLDMFDNASATIEERVHNTSRHISTEVHSDKDTDLKYQIIVGEASVSLFWDNNDWTKFPENHGESQPRYIVPHYIQHFIPDVRLIVILREPVERMYSDYLYFHSDKKSADDFHKAVQYAVMLYNSCIQAHGARQCVYDNSLANKVRVRLRIGMYSVYMHDWLQMFPRQQFHILRLEDYSQKPVDHVKRIYKFLDMRELTVDEEAMLLESPVSNVRKPEDQELGGMHEQTRQILHDFYHDFNLELAHMLADTNYLWKDES